MSGLASASGEQGDSGGAELPTFRPLPGARRYSKVAERAPPGEEAQRAATSDSEQAPRTDIEIRVGAATKRAERNRISEVVAPACPVRVSGFHGTLGLIGMLMLGIGIGGGVPYLAQIVDVSTGSYAEHARAAASYVAAVLGGPQRPILPSVVAEPEPASVRVGSSKNASSDGPQMDAKSSKHAAGDAAAAPIREARTGAQRHTAERNAGSDTRTADLALLVRRAERQIANHYLEQLLGDNALETYHKMVAVSPDDLATTLVGERLSTALWLLAMDAKAAGDWDTAVHKLDLLKGLPPVPAAILARAERAPSGDGQSAARATPADVSAVGASNGKQNIVAEKDRVPEGTHATATASSGVAQETGSLALDRGDTAMRSGDVLAARRYYQFAASAGVAGAAKGVARTYDPIYLEEIGVRGVRPDPAAAMRWYEKAIEEDDIAAGASLDQLLSALEKMPPKPSPVGVGSP